MQYRFDRGSLEKASAAQMPAKLWFIPVWQARLCCMPDPRVRTMASLAEVIADGVLPSRLSDGRW